VTRRSCWRHEGGSEEWRIDDAQLKGDREPGGVPNQSLAHFDHAERRALLPYGLRACMAGAQADSADRLHEPTSARPMMSRTVSLPGSAT
jgi:hypothetical protein